jgi:hypothetical protein
VDALRRTVADRSLPETGVLGETTEELVSATLGLDHSALPVQGPPGTGKTFNGARMIIAALADGRRVARSEERRVGKECRSRWSPYH